MNKKVSVIITIMIIIIFFILIPSVIYFTHRIDEIKIFKDINEFESFSKLKTNKIIEDEYVKNITYIEKNHFEMRYKNRKYTIYSYVFESTEDSQKYFNAVTGDKRTRNSSYLLSSNVYINSKFIGYKDNRVYRIIGSDYISMYNIMEYMNIYLTDKLDE